MYIIYTVREVQISIQALREEGDSGVYAFRAVGMEFLSTPSARRATCTFIIPLCTGSYFYPRPPRGGRRLHHQLLS